MKIAVDFDPLESVRMVDSTGILVYNSSIEKVLHSGIEIGSSLCNLPNPTKSSESNLEVKKIRNIQFLSNNYQLPYTHRFNMSPFSSEGGLDPLLISYSDLQYLLGGISKSTIQRNVKKGILPSPITISRNRRMFVYRDIQKVIGRMKSA